MSLRTLQELKQLVGKRLVGLDLGTKTIGVAVSDPLWKVAMPVETIRRVKLTADLERLRQLMAEREVGAVVIGLPVSLDGSEGPRCQSARAFGRNLEQAFGPTDILYWDERMSTAAVQRRMIDELDMRRDKRVELIDAHAAAYILEGVLEALARVKSAVSPSSGL